MDAGDADQAKTSTPESPVAPAKEDPMEVPGVEGKKVEEEAGGAGDEEAKGAKAAPTAKASDDEAEEVVTLANLEGPRGATIEAVSAEDVALGQGPAAQTAVLEAALGLAEGQTDPACSPAAADQEATAGGSSNPEANGEEKEKDEVEGEKAEEDAKPDEEEEDKEDQEDKGDKEDKEDEEDKGDKEDKEDEEDKDEEEVEPVEEFDKEKWDEENCKYGIVGLMRVFEAMQPMPKSEDASRLKLLIGGGATFPAADDSDREPSEKPERPNRNKGKGKGDRKEQQQQQSEAKGHYISDMGKTEVYKGSRAGQWWRNCAEGNLDVIVREHFSLFSTELCKIPPGQYVQQGGPCEVFVSGRAMGLQRMPVLPRGWATVDATTVGGPKYLQMVRKPLWKIVYRSGSAKGDIVVREQLSLDSPEVAVLTCGARVEQTGALEKLEDGIVRMPISFKQNIAKDPTDGTQPARVNTGWVTCDAVAQGGPKFFEPCSEEEIAQGTGGATSSFNPNGKGEGKGPRPHRREGGGGGGGGNDGDWDKSRMWKVVNAGGDGDRKLAIVTRPEPYAPGRAPPEELFVKWLQEGDRLEQIGHSKKMRGFMVMPVRVIGGAEGEGGWVTRRVVDKARDTPEDVWFVELRNGQEVEPRDRRRANNNRRRDDD